MTRLVLAGADAKAGAEFTSFTAGGLHTCGVMADGSVACWGSHGSGRATTPRSLSNNSFLETTNATQ